MTITAKVLADSMHFVGRGSRRRARRLTSFEVRYPRFIHAEFLTHKLFSRNSASSRAIPISKMIADVLEDPAMFVYWGRNQSGMQAATELSGEEIEWAKIRWLRARDAAVEHARSLSSLGLHKQSVNRVLEPWMHITVILTATDYANFYKLRCHPDAQPEMQALAYAMRSAHFNSVPVDRTELTGIDRWHLPLVTDEERREVGDDAIKVSTGRCARVSYLTHDGRRDPLADIELHDRLAASGHWSPFEHVACPLVVPWWAPWRSERSGNLFGWEQYRKRLPAEHPFTGGQVFP